MLHAFFVAPGRKRKTGLSLVEVLISAALFLVVSTAVLLVLKAGQSNKGHLDDQEQALRACLVGVEQVRSELDVAWVESVDTTTNVIVYHHPTLKPDGSVALTATGDVIWSVPIQLELSGSRLVRTFDVGGAAPEVRLLAQLGPGGTFVLQKVSSTLLKVTLRSTYGAGYELSRELKLPNQS